MNLRASPCRQGAAQLWSGKGCGAALFEFIVEELTSAEHHCGGGWCVVQEEAGLAGVAVNKMFCDIAGYLAGALRRDLRLEEWGAVETALGWHHRVGAKSFLTAEYLCLRLFCSRVFLWSRLSLLNLS